MRINLDIDSATALARRMGKGTLALTVAWGDVPTNEEDRESAAKDAISNILTALYGPAGHTAQQGPAHWKVEHDADAQQNAQELLDRAFQSYLGDAEDYSVPLP